MFTYSFSVELLVTLGRAKGQITEGESTKMEKLLDENNINILGYLISSRYPLERHRAVAAVVAAPTWGWAPTRPRPTWCGTIKRLPQSGRPHGHGTMEAGDRLSRLISLYIKA